MMLAIKIIGITAFNVAIWGLPLGRFVAANAAMNLVMWAQYKATDMMIAKFVSGK